MVENQSELELRVRSRLPESPTEIRDEDIPF